MKNGTRKLHFDCARMMSDSSHFYRWMPEPNWSNTLALIGLTAPILFTAYKRQTQLLQLKNNYFPNVLHVQLFSIVPSRRYPHKYSLHNASILKDDIRNVIYNYHGQRILQKYWRRCSRQDPLIRIEPLVQHHIVLNSIITKVHEKFADQWIYRDCALTMDRTRVAYDAINAQMYVLALVNTNVFDCNGDDINQFKRVRAMLIKSDTLKYFAERHSASSLSQREWDEMLDTDYATLYGSEQEQFVAHCLRGWKTVKKILEEYEKHPKTFDKQLKWGRPLAAMELPCSREEGVKEIYNPPPFSGWNVYEHKIPLEDVLYASQTKQYNEKIES